MFSVENFLPSQFTLESQRVTAPSLRMKIFHHDRSLGSQQYKNTNSQNADSTQEASENHIDER